MASPGSQEPITDERSLESQNSQKTSAWQKILRSMEDARDKMAKSCCSCCRCVEKLPAIFLIIAICLFVVLLLALIPAVFFLTSAVAGESSAMESAANVPILRNEFPFPPVDDHSLEEEEESKTFGFPLAMLLPSNVSLCHGFGFACTNDPNFVISSSQRCDGFDDCPDRSDEMNCLQCQSPLSCRARSNSEVLVCLRPEKLCDNVAHCPDAFDEAQCNKESCGEGEFRCEAKSGRSTMICLPAEAKCDGIADCRHGEDELECEQCNGGAKKCQATSSCVSHRHVCDGTKQCPEGDDEEGCDCKSCSGNHKAICDDHTCLANWMICDGKNDCSNGMDEEGCPGTCAVESKSVVVKCLDGREYMEHEACSGDFDQCQYYCSDCSKGQSFTCSADTLGGNNKCIAMTQVCDGRKDCSDGEDEKDCECEADEILFKCADSAVSKCVKEDARCNGIWDCMDGSDERECSECKDQGLFCERDQTCLSSSHRCDGVVDCSDGFDEKECTCDECLGKHSFTYMCSSGRCLRRSEVCAPYSLCPNATIEDRQFCASVALRKF